MKTSQQNNLFDDDVSDYSFYRKRYDSYRKELSSWKKDSNNIVFPSVGYSDNSFAVHPSFIGGDIYRLFYHQEPQITKPEKGREAWFDIVSQIPTYGLGQLTHNSSFWSSLVTEAIIKEMNKNGEEVNAKGTEKEGQQSRHLSKSIQKGLQEAMKEVSATSNFLSEMGIDPNELETDKKAGDSNEIAQFLKNRRELIRSLNFNQNKAIEFLRQANKYFNTSVGRPYQVQDDLLNNNSFHDILNPELLILPHEIFNLKTYAYNKSVKVDLYVDTSSSMSERISDNINRMDIVSIFSFKIIRTGIVDGFFGFNNTVYDLKKDKSLFINYGGGTSFDNLTRHFEKRKSTGSKNLAFVLTDGECSIHTPHKDIYWLFMGGSIDSTVKKAYPSSQMRHWSQTYGLQKVT
jgi:hypothetical protein